MAELNSMNRKQLISLAIKQKEALKHGHKYFLVLCSLLAQSEGTLLVEGSTFKLFSDDPNEYLIETVPESGDLRINLLDRQMRRVSPAGAWAQAAERVPDDSVQPQNALVDPIPEAMREEGAPQRDSAASEENNT